MLSGFTRMKRVTDPLNDDVKARIVGRCPDYLPNRGGDDGVSSPSLSELFYGFNAGDSSPAIVDSDREPSMRYSTVHVAHLITPIVESMQRDAFGNLLAAHVSKAARMFSGDKRTARRSVTAYLRNIGYNAAVCNTKWERSGGISAGEHEFIDVLRTENSVRYFVELDFAAEFVIARPADFYQRLTQHFPAIFVGTEDDLKRMLEVASNAAKQSLRMSGLHLPPWRTRRFMQNKWLGPYRRTTNVFLASFSSSSSPAKPIGYGVKCRAVGFNAAVNDRFLMFPVPARTR